MGTSRPNLCSLRCPNLCSLRPEPDLLSVCNSVGAADRYEEAGGKPRQASLTFVERRICYFYIVGPDQNMVTKRPQSWPPELILGAFCTIFRARPVGTGLGAKLGRKPAYNFGHLFKAKVSSLSGKVKQLCEQAERSTSKAEKQLLLHQVRRLAAPATGDACKRPFSKSGRAKGWIRLMWG